MKLGRTRVVAMACMLLVSTRTAAQSPLDHAHAHNDYEHARPLLDALDRGYGSVEADIFLVDGALLVAHARDSVRADRTLESLYLAPLRAWIGAHDGSVYAGRPPVTLLIDVKSDAESTWVALEPLLRRYDDVLVSWHGDSTTTRPVVAVISGERPLVTLPAQRDRWAGLDGRLEDLDTIHATPAATMPMVSDDWDRITDWRGRGAPPDSARRRVASVVARAHAQGRRLRFWNTPDLPVVWRLLEESGVDLIGADDLDALRLFLSDSTEVPISGVVLPARPRLRRVTAGHAPRVQRCERPCATLAHAGSPGSVGTHSARSSRMSRVAISVIA